MILRMNVNRQDTPFEVIPGQQSVGTLPVSVWERQGAKDEPKRVETLYRPLTPQSPPIKAPPPIRAEHPLKARARRGRVNFSTLAPNVGRLSMTEEKRRRRMKAVLVFMSP